MNKKYLIILLGILLIGVVYSTGMPDPYGDYDSDGVLNKDDNCYYVYNPFQTDTYGNGIGDACDGCYIMAYCGNGWCDAHKNENESNCPQDCGTPSFCGNEEVENGEECDYGELNGILCDNSTSSCNYCNSVCELITLPYSEEPTTHIKASKSFWQISLDKQFCEPNWKCSAWGECENNWRTRKCSDTNHCVYSYNKPIENTDCGIISSVLVEQQEEKTNWIFISSGVIITLILSIILVNLLKKK